MPGPWEPILEHGLWEGVAPGPDSYWTSLGLYGSPIPVHGGWEGAGPGPQDPILSHGGANTRMQLLPPLLPATRLWHQSSPPLLEHHLSLLTPQVRSNDSVGKIQSTGC